MDSKLYPSHLKNRHKNNMRVGGAELSGVFKKQIYDIVGLAFLGLFVFGIVCLFVCVSVCCCLDATWRKSPRIICICYGGIRSRAGYA